MFTGNSDAAWERYGKSDPYFGVAGDEKYKIGNLDKDSLQEFFQSGEKHVNLILGFVREHLDKDFQPTRALDFGCGVGRLTIPLARACSHVVGIDVSDSMLDEARENCLREGVVEKVDLVKSDDNLSRALTTFDFVTSFITFQHIPPRRGESILKTIVDRLDTNGVGALHFLYSRKSSRAREVAHWTRSSIPLANNFMNLIQRKPLFYPLMQMNVYNLRNIFSLLQNSGCGHSYVRFMDHGEHLGVLLLFQKKALPTL